MNSCPCCGSASAISSRAESGADSGADSPAGSGATSARTTRRSSASAGTPQSDDASRCKVLTVGHSTRPLEDFLALLVAHHVTQLVDVRTLPRSRHNPQFNADTLPVHLAALAIGHAHAPGLGGFRHTTPESPNTGWRNLSFRGYADYMQGAEFAENLRRLIVLTQQDRVALMCAEAVPWRCHRSIIADALVVRGIATCEIVSVNRLQAHRLTPFARVSGDEITYPPAES